MIKAGQRRSATGKQFAVVIQFVGMFDLGASAACHGRRQLQQVIVSCGLAISDVEFDDGEKDALCFKFAVAPAACAKQFCPAEFEPHGVR